MGRRGAERPSQAQRPLKPGPTGRRRMACGQSPPEIALSQCGRPYASLLWPEPAGNSRPHSPRSFDLPYPPCFEPPDCPQTPPVSQISPQHTPLASLDGGFGLGKCSDLRGSEQPAAFQEGIETSSPPGAKEGCQGHLAVGALP